MTRIPLKVQRLSPDAVLPTYAREGDAGADLYSTQDRLLTPGESTPVGTGIALAIPNGYVGLIHPRSGLAANFGVTVLNTPGTIDSGYRGEIMVILHNTSAVDFLVERGMRIAQIVFQEFASAEFEAVESLDATVRGQGGLGSSGV